MYKTNLALLLIVFVTTIQAHLTSHQWMRKNNIDEDFMHMHAMKARRQAHVVLKLLHEHNYVSSMGTRTVKEKQFGEYLSEIIPRTQFFFYGFINGTNSLQEASTCVSAITKIVDEAFLIIDNRFFWLPQEQMFHMVEMHHYQEF